MARWTEEEAAQFGLIKDKNGNWHQREAGVPRCNPCKMPKLESGAVKRVKTKNETQDRDEKDSDSRYRIVVTATYRRFADPDNLCPKWFIDRLAEYGIIQNDSSEFIYEIIKRIKKVKPWGTETTTIEVYRLG